MLNQNKPPCLAIVVPCFNEEKILEKTIPTLIQVLNDLQQIKKVSENSFLYFVDDGSYDATWTCIENANKIHSSVRGLKLSTNAGHQNALFAGLMHVINTVDCAVTIDADLQDDISVIEQMIDAYQNNNEIVYAVKHDRSKDHMIKRLTANFFYRFMRFLGVNIVINHADFRLLGKRALTVLSKFDERNLFLRGIIPLIGFQTTCVYENIKHRHMGSSKYTYRKMLSLAWNGITSFSVFPLRVISFIGALIFIFSLIMSCYVLFAKFYGDVVMGWASTLLPIYFLGGIQLLSIGIIGEYLGKLYLEIKKRPRFIKEKEV